MNDEELLNDLFYTKKNYDGINELYKKAKLIHPNITKLHVQNWLKKQQVNQITYKKVGAKYCLPIYSETTYAFQIDLTFFPRYKKQNYQYYVLFTAININTRYAYAYYSKDKNMHTILDMINKMEKKTIINSISCDEGTEFKNSEFKTFCEEKNIELFLIKSDGHKLGIINRFHRTIKEKLTKHFQINDTVNWIDIIDKIIYNYNHSVNRGVGIEPYKINSFIEHEIILRKREETERINNLLNDNEKFNINDKVRIINKTIVFKDKMLPKYSSTV